MTASGRPTKSDAQPAPITLRGVFCGIRDITPIAVLVVPLAIAFGVAATQQGLSPWMAMLMSLLVCAGASQFAALDLWVSPLPVLLILMITLAINARHLIYGAAIYPWLSTLPAGQRYAILSVLTDASWAYAMDGRQRYGHDVGILIGSSLMLWVTWTAATFGGALFGTGIGNPKTFGLDVLMVVFFSSSLMMMWRGRDDLKPWLAATVASLLAMWLLPSGWYIIVGALAGGVTGVLTDDA
jgi:4-azaleucine resistance transporter AzlC